MECCFAISQGKLHTKFTSDIEDHQLRDEIICSSLSNSVVNRAGITFIYRLVQQTGVSVANATRAYLISRDVFEINELWKEIDKLNSATTFKIQAKLIFELQRLLLLVTSWFIEHDEYLLDMSSAIEIFSRGLKGIYRLHNKISVGKRRKKLIDRLHQLQEEGVPRKIAIKIEKVHTALSALEIIELSVKTNIDLTALTFTFFETGDKIHRIEIDTLLDTKKINDIWDDCAATKMHMELSMIQANLTKKIMMARDKDSLCSVNKWFNSRRKCVFTL